MAISFSSLQSGFLKYIEAVPVISAADVGSDATKIIDAALSIYGDGYFNDYWIYVTSGLASGDVRQIQDHDKSTTTLTPYVNFSAAVAAGNTYEIHKENPDMVQKAINDALVSLVSRPDPRTRRTHKLYKRIIFEDLGLSLLTANTAAPPTKNVIVADATLFFVNQKVTIKDNNASEDAQIASINTTTDTLTMVANLTNSYTTAAKAKVIGKSGHYFNLGRTIGQARITGVFIRADGQRKPFADFHIITSLTGARQIYFPSSKPVDDQVWVIEVMGALEQLSAPGDTLTIDDHRVNLVYAESAYHFYSRQAQLVSAGDYTRLFALAAFNRDKVDVEYRGLWLSLPQERISLD